MSCRSQRTIFISRSAVWKVTVLSIINVRQIPLHISIFLNKTLRTNGNFFLISFSLVVKHMQKRVGYFSFYMLIAMGQGTSWILEGCDYLSLIFIYSLTIFMHILCELWWQSSHYYLSSFLPAHQARPPYIHVFSYGSLDLISVACLSMTSCY